MRREWESTVEQVRALAGRVARGAIVWGADRRNRRLLVGGGFLACLVIGMGAVWLWPAAAATGRVGDDEADWRYLLVCRACQARTHWVSHPRRECEERKGWLRCPDCDGFEATWHRRGSQAIPPGGWSTSRPTADSRGGGVGKVASP